MFRKINPALAIGIIVIIAAAVGVSAWWMNQSEQSNGGNSKPVVCTQEAKQCPDGSFVSRTDPNCEFAPCPEETGSCIKEGEIISTMPLPYPDADRIKCCEGLSEIPLGGNSTDAGYCTKCGDGLCKAPEYEENCPSDCVGNSKNQRMCTQEAKRCPNGGFVSRTGPNCEFAPCPENIRK
jgi:hypothetical protein